MKKTMLLATVATLALCVGGAASAAKHPTITVKTAHTQAKFKTANRDLTVLYDQNSDSEGYGDISQNFESSFDAYDSQGADDFTVPKGSVWVINEVDVSGIYFNGPGLADSENVFIYKGNKKHPKTLVAEVDNVVGDDDGIGNFVITLPNKGIRLKKGGEYWVSVQVNMDFSVGGEWGWTTRNTQVGTAAQWQNPGDGFGTGCTTWKQENICLENAGVVVAGPDHEFTLRGKSR